MSRERQVEQVLQRLRIGPLTDSEARSELGISRLGARIWDLKRAGYSIGRAMVVVYNRHGEKCRVARYNLNSRDIPGPGMLMSENSCRRLLDMTEKVVIDRAPSTDGDAKRDGTGASQAPRPSLEIVQESLFKGAE